MDGEMGKQQKETLVSCEELARLRVIKSRIRELRRTASSLYQRIDGKYHLHFEMENVHCEDGMEPEMKDALDFCQKVQTESMNFSYAAEMEHYDIEGVADRLDQIDALIKQHESS